MRLRKGDPLAEPERLIRRVYAYVSYVVGDAADASEITRLAIERAFRYRTSYDPKSSSGIAWIFGIARYCLADSFREPFATTGDELEELDESNALYDEDDLAAVRAAVVSLGPFDRELIALRHGADLSPREIGEQLGMRASAVEAGLQRAQGRVLAILTARLQEPAGDAA